MDLLLAWIIEAGLHKRQRPPTINLPLAELKDADSPNLTEAEREALRLAQQRTEERSDQ